MIGRWLHRPKKSIIHVIDKLHLDPRTETRRTVHTSTYMRTCRFYAVQLLVTRNKKTHHVLYLIEEVNVDQQDMDKEPVVHKNMQIVIRSFEVLDKDVTRGKQQFKYLMDDGLASICLVDHYNATSSLHTCTKDHKCQRCTHIRSQEMPLSHGGLSHSKHVMRGRWDFTTSLQQRKRATSHTTLMTGFSSHP